MALEKVILQLKWKHQFQFAGYYAAREQGYYREAGLDVDILEAEPGDDVAERVLVESGGYGVGNSSLLLLRQQGKPVVVLAVILQHSPLVLVATGSVDSVHALAGKRVMLEAQSDELLAYFKKEGLGREQMTILPWRGGAAELLEGRVDAMSAYASDELFEVHQARVRHTLLTHRSEGIDFYGDNLFTSEREIREHPLRVKAFREASLKGWQYAMAHPDEMIRLIRTRYSPRHSAEHLAFEAGEMRNLMQPDLVEIGQMRPGRWQHIAEIYQELGMIRSINLNGFLYEPNPETRYLRLYLAIGAFALASLLLGGLAWYFHFLNRRLRLEVATREAVQARLEFSEAQSRRLLEAAPFPVVITGLESGLVCYLNERACQWFRLSLAAGAGARPRDFYAEPSVRDRMVDQLRRDGKVDDFEARLHQGLAGTSAWVLMSVRLLDFEGETAVFASFNDIDARRRDEHSLREAHASLQANLLEIQKLQARLHEQAIRDSLTGLFNRRYMDETLAHELARARREGYPLSVVMIDVDRFKQVNDSFGHPAGDEMLKALGRLLREDCRDGDVACRYGGEEFMLLLPRLEEPAVRERSEVWRRAFETLVVRSGDRSFGATLSCGVAIFPDHGVDVDSLIQRADLALYMAKLQGRNRVVVYGAGMDTVVLAESDAA